MGSGLSRKSFSVNVGDGHSYVGYSALILSSDLDDPMDGARKWLGPRGLSMSLIRFLF